MSNKIDPGSLFESPVRSSQEVFYKGDFRNFAKFTGKHLCQSLFFNKVAGLRPKTCNIIKKETLARVFSCEFCKISENTFFTEHLWTTASFLFNFNMNVSGSGMWKRVISGEKRNLQMCSNSSITYLFSMRVENLSGVLKKSILLSPEGI